MLVEIDDKLCERLSALTGTSDVNYSLSALLAWTDRNLPSMPFIAKGPKQYYDREKYKALKEYEDSVKLDRTSTTDPASS
jgi:hypothetical protein